jgi:steroid delta-isomerase-like uncharacterized protein
MEDIMKTRSLLIGFFGLIVLSIVSAGCYGPGTTSKEDNSAEVEKQTRNILAAYTAHDVDTIISFYSPDAETTDVNGKISKDRNKLRKFTENIFKEFPDFKMEVMDVFAKGNRACARCNITGTASGEGLGGKMIAGKIISAPTAIVLVWKDGKIFRSYDYRNVALVMGQLGLLPAPQPEQQ